MANILQINAYCKELFVTYAITGNLKRMLKSLGLKIEKAPGAPGKREMLRAVRCADMQMWKCADAFL